MEPQRDKWLVIWPPLRLWNIDRIVPFFNLVKRSLSRDTPASSIFLPLMLFLFGKGSFQLTFTTGCVFNVFCWTIAHFSSEKIRTLNSCFLNYHSPELVVTYSIHIIGSCRLFQLQNRFAPVCNTFLESVEQELPITRLLVNLSKIAVSF